MFMYLIKVMPILLSSLLNLAPELSICMKFYDFFPITENNIKCSFLATYINSYIGHRQTRNYQFTFNNIKTEKEYFNFTYNQTSLFYCLKRNKFVFTTFKYIINVITNSYIDYSLLLLQLQQIKYYIVQIYDIQILIIIIITFIQVLFQPLLPKINHFLYDNQISYKRYYQTQFITILCYYIAYSLLLLYCLLIILYIIDADIVKSI
eukprot:TRINITY_DN5798_c0_g1_i1.p1 TRINITY_DN5798_c0_g1~~TRINITY_DN5798_c0_g1_i1.p1  ORF type:complete len:207 (-),score=-32.44 TRINITY_DN5798_c0_g1_i1:252-872(-)